MGDAQPAPAAGAAATTTAAATPTTATTTTAAAPPSSFKVVVLGAAECGKSALISQWLDGMFIDTYAPTRTAPARSKELQVDGDAVTLSVVDTPGRGEQESARDAAIEEGDGFVLVYAVNSRPSFEKIGELHRLVSKSKRDEDVPCVIVGTKFDLTSERTVSAGEGSDRARQLGAHFMEVSNKDAKADRCFAAAAAEVRARKLPPLPLDKEGWLEKRGHVRKNWKRRWFVLRGLEMAYFSKQQAAGVPLDPKKPDAALKGRITLQGCKVVEDPENQYGFCIKTIMGKDFPIRCASEREKRDWMNTIVRARDKPLAAQHLLEFAERGDLANVRKLLKEDVEVDWQERKHSRTALHLAAKSGHLPVVRLLLKFKARVDVQDKNKWTALSLAARYQHLEVLVALLEHGATIDMGGQEASHGNALLVAVDMSDLRMVKALVEHGANVNATNRQGSIALHLAAQNGEFPLVKYLVDAGSAFDTQDSDGETPLFLAVQKGISHLEIVKFLLDKGARLDRKSVRDLTVVDVCSPDLRPILDEFQQKAAATTPDAGSAAAVAAAAES